jgi:hypothetical protein
MIGAGIVSVDVESVIPSLTRWTTSRWQAISSWRGSMKEVESPESRPKSWYLMPRTRNSEPMSLLKNLLPCIAVSYAVDVMCLSITLMTMGSSARAAAKIRVLRKP